MARERLSLGYRIGWRVRYLLNTFFGPAELGQHDDPQMRLRRERERKLEELRRSSGS